jgi:hypothetical protein
MSDFGRDARSLATGTRASVDPPLVGRVEDRLIEAARTIARSDEAMRQQLAGELVIRPWNEIR